MKKIIFVMVILLVATLCLTSCDLTGGDQYQKLNQMVNKSYSQVKMEVSVKKSGESIGLNSVIVCDIARSDDVKTVQYNLQEYASIDVNGDTITLPSQQIVTKSGSVILSNGEVISQTGDQVGLNFAKVGKITMNFVSVYLSNVKTENGIFSADVTNVIGFLGRDIFGATDVKVSVDVQTYKSITLSYVVNSSDVTIVYTLV